MAHTHDEGHNAYYLDQLCTVGICAALGVMSILMWAQGSLTILAQVFQTAVLIGGIALLLVAVVRGITLWAESRRPAGAHHHNDHAHDHAHDHVHAHDHGHHHHHDHDHGHEHGAACAHDHPHTHEHATAAAAPHDHSHGHGDDHGHEHGWAPVRYAVLLLPITLFFLGMPNQAFNAEYGRCTLQRAQGELPPLFAVWFYGATVPERKSVLGDDPSIVKLDDKGGEVLNLNFKELSQAAFSPGGREFYEGKTGVLKGQFSRSSSDKVFTLVRMKITCCAADAIPLNVPIVSPEPVSDIPPLQWVEVTGQIQFRKPRPDREEYVPVLQVAGRDAVKKADPDYNPFVY